MFYQPTKPYAALVLLYLYIKENFTSN